MFVLQEALLGDVLRYRTPSTRFDLLLRGKPLDRLVALFASHGLPFSGAGMPPLPTEAYPGFGAGASTFSPQPPRTPPQPPQSPRTPPAAGRSGAASAEVAQPPPVSLPAVATTSQLQLAENIDQRLGQLGLHSSQPSPAPPG